MTGIGAKQSNLIAFSNDWVAPMNEPALAGECASRSVVFSAAAVIA